MCGIWDWQSTIVKDLNDSQDPKHTLFCHENTFGAISAFIQTKNVHFLPVHRFLVRWLPFNIADFFGLKSLHFTAQIKSVVVGFHELLVTVPASPGDLMAQVGDGEKDSEEVTVF